MNLSRESRRGGRPKLIWRVMPVAAIAAAGIGVGVGSASAFTPGTGCGTGTGSSAGISAEAHFVSLPSCAGYIRVVTTCQASSGSSQVQFGPIRTYPTSSAHTCASPYNANLASWGWQVSGTP
ncbi:MAG: hypothetical protein JWM34_1072 [Ilumatobacteraceae bacterium]|nr:hypothetical protein [Ilumatobacteraceae bacterium]